eukprot:CAMPEP_0118876814 /NCGR_PEP_ID=MMETSP1163-20130328/17352_1 /TAXON_ID=124430 /ORGANISM="Phaeomonas parva, Strain CCMP2877" /LENGTH=396 /DNA_ID=CAMNT_0006812455 /DNA_START=10 /DNA_END=1197 /DNA_ORIENTATION=-
MADPAVTLVGPYGHHAKPHHHGPNTIDLTRGPVFEPVKIFVGQVPRTLEEQELLPMFQDYGDVLHINVLRDKVSGLHRGCCFVTYSTREEAEAAIEALHNKVKLVGALNPLQVREADAQTGEREHKLYVGMLGSHTTDDELIGAFSPYGSVKEIHIMRNSDGSTKGWGFVKFHKRDAANDAINALSGKLTLPGAHAPLVVKYAGARKPTRVQLQQRQQYGHPAASGGPHGGSAHPSSYWNGMPGGSPGMPGQGNPQGVPGYPQQFPQDRMGLNPMGMNPGPQSQMGMQNVDMQQAQNLGLGMGMGLPYMNNGFPAPAYVVYPPYMQQGYQGANSNGAPGASNPNAPGPSGAPGLYPGAAGARQPEAPGQMPYPMSTAGAVPPGAAAPSAPKAGGTD